MKVKIICGVYGHRPDKNHSRVVRKDNTCPPFELEDAEAQRIIELGIAESCEDDRDQDLSDNINTEHQSAEGENGTITTEEVMLMGYIDMKKLAKKLGVDAKGTKEELRDRLKNVLDDIEVAEKEQQTSENAESDVNSDEQSVSDDSVQDMDQEMEEDEKPPLLEAQVPV